MTGKNGVTGISHARKLSLVCCFCSPACALHADRSAHSFALRVGRLFHSLSPEAHLPLRSAFRRSLTIPPLPSANTFANVFSTLTGFTYRGLSPHWFTPMPGVHNGIHQIPKASRLLVQMIPGVR